MSLLTRCPACTTLYKVVPDQLRISQGWVKCGQCGEIFDASQHLMEAATEPEDLVVDSSSESVPVSNAAFNEADMPAFDNDLQTEPSVQAEQIEQIEQVGDLPMEVAESELVSSSELAAESSTEPPTEQELPPEPAAAVSLAADVGLEIDLHGDQNRVNHEDLASIPPEWEPLDLSSFESEIAPPTADTVAQPDLEPAPQQVPESESAISPAAESVETHVPPAPVSFMRDTGPPSLQNHPHFQSALASLAGLLILALGAQWVYQDHDRLAAARPQWRSVLVNVCKPLRCSVKPWQQIESIAIDAAAFNKLAEDRYRLSFTLKNAASVMLAWPSIELTLTDAQDRVVVRRVLSPPELAAPSDQLAANSELPVLVNLRVKAEASSAAIVGYRLLAFYP